jgi:hypothetical protein
MGSIKKLDVACRVAVNAELPTILLEELLQHVRDFELRHFEVELQFQIEAPEMSGKEVEGVFDRIRPSFNYRTTINTKEGKHVRSRVRG